MKILYLCFTIALLVIESCGSYIIGITHRLNDSKDTFKLTVTTYDGLILPAQLIRTANNSKKILLFINGSTPSDEKGFQGAIWNDMGKMIPEKHEFYLRFIDIMSNKGYSVATMAKRSYVYPTKIPRPTLNELALDVQFFIQELKKSGLLKEEKDLVIVGYSEGSIVATKVLGILKKQPFACVLLGSADMSCDCNDQSIENFDKTDVYRRLKKWTDEQIKTALYQWCEIHKALRNMDEKKFENEFKKSKPFGFGFANWESFYIDKEVQTYNPISNILYANVPLLICIGEDDMAMPMIAGKRTYDRLKDTGYDKVTFRTIEKEVHSYKKYDVFSIINTWLSTNFRSTDFVLDKTDSLFIEKYARANDLMNEISAIPFGGGFPEKIIGCYRKAIEGTPLESTGWFSMGLKLFTDGFMDEAFNSFDASINDTTFTVMFASYVWMGHIKDIQNQRKKALEYYHKAMQIYPGFPVQHDNWNIKIDKAWIEERIKTPFKGIN